MPFEKLEEILPRYALGKHHPSPEQIKQTVLKASDLFTVEEKRRPPHYFARREILAGYLLYFLPLSLNKIYGLLREVLRHPRLVPQEKELRILDLGCGIVPAIFAFLEFRWRGFFPGVYFDYLGVDMDRKALTVAQDLVQTLIPQKERLSCRFLPMDFRKGSCFTELRAFRPHFLVMSNVLGEIAMQGISPIRFAQQIGTFFPKTELVAIFLEPGTRKASQTLHAFRDTLIADMGVKPYSPCLHDFPCPALQEANWCYEEWPWQCPRYLRSLEPLGLQTRHLKFSYVVFTSSGYRLAETFPPYDGLAVKCTSHLLREKKKARLWGCIAGELKDMEKLERDCDEKDPWFTIRKGTYFAVTDCVSQGKKFRLTKDTKLSILYQPFLESQ